MVNKMKKITVFGLIVFVVFCMISCETLGISFGSGSSGSKSQTEQPPKKVTVEIKNNSQFDVQHIYGMDKAGEYYEITDHDVNTIMIKRGSTYNFTFAPAGKDSKGKPYTIDGLAIFVVNGNKTQQVKFPIDFSSMAADSTASYTLVRGSSNEHLNLTPNQAPASSPPNNQPGWQQNRDGTWTYNPGQGRAIPQGGGSSSSSSSSSSANKTDYVYITNSLGGNATIKELYIVASTHSSWGSNLIRGGFLYDRSRQGYSIDTYEQNDANRFNIKVVTDKGAVYTMSNVTISQRGEVEIK